MSSAAPGEGVSSPSYIHRCGACGRVSESYRENGVVCSGCGSSTRLLSASLKPVTVAGDQAAPGAVYIHQCTECGSSTESHELEAGGCMRCDAECTSRAKMLIDGDAGLCEACKGRGCLCGRCQAEPREDHLEGKMAFPCATCHGVGVGAAAMAEVMADKTCWPIILDYPEGYIGPCDPHTAATKIDDDRDSGWKCVDCGETGELHTLLGSGGCTLFHGNCYECGNGPLCARDCAEIELTIAATGLDVVHVEESLEWRAAAKRREDV